MPSRLHKGIKSIMVKIQQLLQVSSYQSVCLAQKLTCVSLNYFMKYMYYLPESNSEEIYTQLRNCAKIIYALVLSTEFQKFGHRLSLFWFLVKQFQNLNQDKITCINSQSFLKRISKNEGSQYYVASKLSPISGQQPNNQQFQSMLTDSACSQSSIHNPQCVCCSKFFIKGLQISNYNPAYPLSVMNLPHKNSNYTANCFHLESLQRYFNAICNQGGGVLLIGAQYKHNIIRAVGINFSTQQSIEHKEQLIRRSLDKIKPSCSYTIQKVLVHKTVDEWHCKRQRTQVNLCFRIMVFPKRTDAFTYLEYKNKETSQNCYECYQVVGPNKVKKIENETDGNIFNNLYTKIMQHYRSKKKRLINSHQHIQCFKPQIFHLPSSIYKSTQQIPPNPQLKYSLSMVYEEPQQSIDQNDNENKQNQHQYQTDSIEITDLEKQIDQNLSETEMENENENENDDIEKEKEFFESVANEIKFKYQNACLFVVSSKKQNRQVYILAKRLKKLKYVFELSRPYYDQFSSKIARPIWLISHQMPVKTLKQVLALLQKKYQIKQKSIKILPINNCLQIQSIKFPPQKQQIFHQQYYRCFSQTYTIEQSEHQGDQRQTFLTFKDNKRSVYGYMICQSMSLRPFFIKMKNGQFKTYKKKC